MDVLQPQDAIVSLCQELVACVTKILDPLSAQADRATCNQVDRIVPINEQAKYIKYNLMYLACSLIAVTLE